MNRNNFIKKALIFTLIILFVCMSITLSSAVDNPMKSTMTVSSGNILYVGGNGTGNYTRIQDAVNDAVDGDTVFVYSYSSPYFETLIVNKSINLIGQDENTTIIDGNFSDDDVIVLSKNWVNITGFTIQNSGDWSTYAGIEIRSNNNTITGNIILNNGGGIQLYDANHNFINNNIIQSNDDTGIDIIGFDNNISMNNISQNGLFGILVFNSNGNTIYSNKIYENSYGISIQNGSYNVIIRNQIYGHNHGSSSWGITTFKENRGNIISENNISNNCGGIDYLGINSEISKNNIAYNTKLGVYLSSPGWLPNKKNVIFKNNFIENGINAYVALIFLSFNVFRGNYWSDWPIRLPKPIFGESFPWITFDWHPAKEPYDIPTSV